MIYYAISNLSFNKAFTSAYNEVNEGSVRKDLFLTETAYIYIIKSVILPPFIPSFNIFKKDKNIIILKTF